MESRLPDLSAGELKLLFSILEKLSRSHDLHVFRENIAEDLLRLLGADFLASFLWNQERRVFEDVVFLNMSPTNIERYDSYYQFCDPITALLQKKRRATQVYEVMPKGELERTEFFNDFLMADGLHHGINLYAYDGDVNIGDLRIWRAKNRPDFKKREMALLDFILPYYRNALRNARAIQAAKRIEGFWKNLLENSHIAFFLFDEAGNCVFRNKNASGLENTLNRLEYASFYRLVQSLAKGHRAHTRWGPYFLSVLPSLPRSGVQPLTAVLASQSMPAKINRAFLETRYRLSPRESEICLLICKGLTDREIASVLAVAFSTVRTHLKHIFIKMDATNRSELITLLLEGTIDISF